MAYSQTTATKKIANLKKRIRIVQGGTSASKTISILLILIALAQSDKKPTVTSVVSESFPHLKKGAIRDFLSILQEHKYFKEDSWNKTDYIYTFETGSKIEFFSVDQSGKVRGPRRDRLFLNEANNIDYESFEQLEIRTREFIFADYNPTSEFWVHTEILNNQNYKDITDFVILTYKDNEALSPEIVQSIERKRNNKNFWTVYGLGLVGKLEGLIYKNWEIVDEIPKEAKLERRWLDYGYANDPTAAGSIYKCNGAYYLDELIYQKGLSNKQIADIFLNEEEQVPIAADSAEPKSNDELEAYGLTILPAKKGKDSINNGIQVVQQQKIFVTKRSINILKEQRNYMWEIDQAGKTINVPSPIFNHHMDGIRYAFGTLIEFVSPKTMREQEALFSKAQHRQVLNSTR